MCFKKLKYTITWLLKRSIFQFSLRESSTAVRRTHFCMLHCQKESTHAFTHWLTSLSGRFAPMRNVGVCWNTFFTALHGILVHYFSSFPSRPMEVFRRLKICCWQTTFHHSNTWRNQAKNCTIDKWGIHQPITNELSLIWKRTLFPRPSPYNAHFRRLLLGSWSAGPWPWKLGLTHASRGHIHQHYLKQSKCLPTRNRSFLICWVYFCANSSPVYNSTAKKLRINQLYLYGARWHCSRFLFRARKNPSKI